jgi:cardiolipin synthase
MATTTDRIVTIPNAISALRLVGVPVYFWMLISEHYGWACMLMVFAGVSDYLDGWLARRLQQFSTVGEALDPIADRLYIGFTLIGLAIVDVVAWWLVVAIVARDVVMLGYLLWLRLAKQIEGVEVHYIGKVATTMLLYAFPILVLGEAVPALHDVCRAFGWAWALWGLCTYWYGAFLYLGEARTI